MAHKLIVVTGATGTGKTNLAIELAKLNKGELINADSRQIYKYLNIGTNKEKLKPLGIEAIDSIDYPVFAINNSDIPIHLIDFLEPDKRFSAYKFQSLAYDLIPKIWDRGHTPILVGGTGLYIDIILNPEKYNDDEANFDSELRDELEAMSTGDLQKKLIDISPEVFNSLNNSDKSNPRRLVRRIEKELSKGAHSKKEMHFNKLNPTFVSEVHYLQLDWVDLQKKLDNRVELMFEEGIVDEVRYCLRIGLSPQSVALQGIGYREVLSYVDGEIALEECVDKVKTAHKQYAKRQITWFKKYL